MFSHTQGHYTEAYPQDYFGAYGGFWGDLWGGVKKVGGAVGSTVLGPVWDVGTEVVGWAGDQLGLWGSDSWTEAYSQLWTGQLPPGSPGPQEAATAALRDPQKAQQIAARLERVYGIGPHPQDMKSPGDAPLWINAAMGVQAQHDDPALAIELVNWVTQTVGYPGHPSGGSYTTTSQPPASRAWYQDILDAAGGQIRNVAEDKLRQLIASAPPELQALAAQEYAKRTGTQAAGAAKSALPWILGAGALFLLTRK